MTNKRHKNIKLFLFLILLFTFVYFILQWWSKNYVQDLLSEKLPSHFVLMYTDLDVNILSGSVVLLNPSLKISNKDTLQNHTDLKLESLQLKGIGYWDILFNETLSIKNILLKNPKLHHYPYKKMSSKKTNNNANNKGIKTIKFDELNITNGNIHIMKQSVDSIKISVSSFDLKISESHINLLADNKKSINYNRYNLIAKNIILGKSDYETFKVDHLNADEKKWEIENLQIIPKYTKRELSRHVSKERDYINLNIPKVILNNLDFNFDEERFGVTINSAEIEKPNLEIYRDKLLPDDLTTKPLYSKSLRKLNFDLAVNKTEIKNGYISYAELVEPDKKAGKLFFNKVDATINHLTNDKNAQETAIKIHSSLMGKAPLELNWNFDVNNASDAFNISGAVSDLPAEDLNPFFKPNLNALAEGTLQQMYFTFYGNTTKSKGEIKMKYEDFKFEILQKNGFKINKVLTAIGNIFINDGSATDAEGFRHGAIEAQRNVTKSFFNYLWINVKSGLVSTLTGNGKKK
ncbi:DUF748 domain-containing protein [Mariniflexile gromovii]|uniref:DUF748 domain-containing protein n=1 Tax=Mariniflexile gromovii TaxID=362523 RepID=A0ABS4BSV4_9FLAO|nr:DUF748 domain-containing protein [Mariniflexile gromovii]MBP0903676.1 DUF748 domain-containing protein [Mariniflexile gromovii]